MEYLYAAMILNRLEKEIDSDSISEVLRAADVEVDVERVELLVQSLNQLDIDEAMATPFVPVQLVEEVVEEQETIAEEEKEDPDEEEEDEVLTGFDLLFGN